MKLTIKLTAEEVVDVLNNYVAEKFSVENVAGTLEVASTSGDAVVLYRAEIEVKQ